MAGSTDVAADHAGEGDHQHEEHEHTSRWPLIAAGGAAALYLGAGLFFVGLDLVPALLPTALAAVGAIVLVAGLGGWANEAFIADYREKSGVDQRIYTGGMVLFLVSDVATFSAGFIYYAFIRVGTWPPENLPPLVGSLVAINTLILVASSVTVHYAHHALEEGNRQRFLVLLGATLFLGLVFVGGQIYEYYEFIVHEGFTLTSGVFASAFFGLTGLHGLHVALGAVLLGITFGRALKGHYSAERDTAVRTASLYWHFVDAVWIFLVLVVYVGAAGL